MGNLIESFGQFRNDFGELEAIQSVDEAINELKKAHKFVSERAHKTLKEAAEIQPTVSWGSKVKRRRVNLPQTHETPILVRWASGNHNLSELINMCATVERLLGALAWAKRNRMKEYTVERCHPTTGSRKKRDARVLEGDNDLVLKKAGRTARFEVTDLSGRKDTNRKIDADLRSLGAELRVYPDDRLYLVIAAPSNSEKLDHSHYVNRALRMPRNGFSLQPHEDPPNLIIRVKREPT